MSVYYLAPNGELYHHGVKGMKWGVRRNRGISGSIRDFQKKRATDDISKINSKKKRVKSELYELKGYERNPSKIGKSKLSTAIRRSQIKSLEKTQNKLNAKEKENKLALKELDSIERYQAKKRADKAIQKLNKQKIKDLKKRYGELEDSMGYGKSENIGDNKKRQAEMNRIDNEIRKLSKR